MKYRFTKMQGCGNDYIYFNCFEQQIENPEKLSIRLSDRHFGIGGDGIILICPSEIADAKMRIFNADGSEGKMCGNGIRCVGKYLFEHGIVTKKQILIETLSGIKELVLFEEQGKITSVRVNMGKAILKPSLIPVNLEGPHVINRPVEIGSKQQNITCVSMGNPHCVIFVDDPMGLDLEKIGRQFETNPLFPEGVNTEFVKIINPTTLLMRVWERGSGETWACGTGACAAAVAGVLNGYAQMDSDILVKLRGGDLIIKYTEDAVYMTGKAEEVFDGTIEA